MSYRNLSINHKLIFSLSFELHGFRYVQKGAIILKKPSNRKERMDLIERKLGLDFASALYRMTDGELKKYMEHNFNRIIKMPDYSHKENTPTCLRCGCQVDIEFHTYCQCGKDRTVYSEEDWKKVIENDIEENAELSDADMEFINNGYKVERRK